MHGRIPAVILVVMLSPPSMSFAQPTAWVTQRLFAGFQTLDRVHTVDLATGISEFSLELPAGVEVGGGALSADGQFYLLATSIGIARFRTQTKVFEGFFGPAGSASRVQVSPSGRWVFVHGASGLSKLDAVTGQVVSHECCGPVVLAFTPDGSTRIEIRQRLLVGGPISIVSAHDDVLQEPPLWDVTAPGLLPAASAIDDARLALVVSTGTDQQTILFDVSNGAELGRIPRGGALAFNRDALLMSR